MKEKMHRMIIGLCLMLAIGVMAALTGFTGQQKFTSLSSGSSMSVSGTSSLHDWTVTLNDFNCDMTALMESSTLKIQAVSFKGKSKTLKSDNSTMDRKIQEALNSSKHPEISFTINNTRDVVVNGDKFSGTINGSLVIAGITRTENIPINGHMLSNNRIQIKGSKKLKMTDFKISPPTAMLGALKTGDDVTVSFTLVMGVR